LVTALATDLGVPEADVAVHFTQGLYTLAGLSTTLVWMRVSNLDGTAKPEAQEQLVVRNMTNMVGDVELAQVYLGGVFSAAAAEGAAPAARALSEAAAAGSDIVTVDTVPIPPAAICIPKTEGAAAAAASGGPSFWMFVALLMMVAACYYKRKAGKKKKKSAEEKAASKADKDEKKKSKKEQKEEALAAAAAGAAAAAAEGQSEADKQREEFDNLLKEGKAGEIIDMFLNDAFTPGIDDSADVMVNPVLAYIVNQERARLKEEEAKRGDGDGEDGEINQDDLSDLTKKPVGNLVKEHKSLQQDDYEDDNPNRFRRRSTVSPLKMINFDFKKGPQLDETKQKVVKVVEGHLQKQRDIDIKKVPLKPDHKVMRDDLRYQKVRVITYNAAKAAGLVSVDETQPGKLGEEKVKKRATAASGARKQLAKKVLKTKVEELGDDAAKKKDEEDEEGDDEEGGGKEDGAVEEEKPPEDNHPPELKCSICQLLFLDPQDLPCGHYFCHECILDTWQVTAKMACPTCNTPTWKRQLKPRTALATQVENYKKANNISD